MQEKRKMTEKQRVNEKEKHPRQKTTKIITMYSPVVLLWRGTIVHTSRKKIGRHFLLSYPIHVPLCIMNEYIIFRTSFQKKKNHNIQN
ncbi:Os01g0809450 [Oryza sativa Japonica Group]|uniref:Os01g0809450 protein n=1 Tax=Oryza sativa subsp. japonica TaxID=39947 RepID=A0A0P0V9K3_ORYSJ|nr:hypothetical protein EE612_006389 [Oryza sativa]BAS74859.1 Os01g0809450 [Oryza sativa Japonica Group]